MSDIYEIPGDRLLFAIKNAELNQRKFSQLIGMSPNGINSIIKGKKRLSKTLALATEQITGVNAEWILDEQMPVFVDPNSKIDPWHRLVIETLKPLDSQIYERVIAGIEQETSKFRNSLDSDFGWNEEEQNQFQSVIKDAKKILMPLSLLESDEGQAPFRAGLLVLSGKFSFEEVLSSEAGIRTDQNFKSNLEALRKIRNQLNALINKPI